MDRLIIVEGIPGSGKTTVARKIAKSLRARGKNVQLYVEGDLHPADMAWCACLTQEEYKEVCQQYPEYKKAFEENKSQWHEYVILAYTKIVGLSEQLFHYFEQKEIYDGRSSNELFCEIHKSRWQRFGEEATGIKIFECALLQNSINEWILFRGGTEGSITAYVKELIQAMKKLDPIIIYLSPNPKESIKRAAKERVDDQGHHIWEEGITQYIASSPYGRSKGLVGTLGMYQYFEQRREMEISILEKLSVKKYIVPVDIQHQDASTQQIIQYIMGEIV